MHPGPAGRGPGNKSPVSLTSTLHPPSSCCCFLGAEGTGSRRRGGSCDAVGGTEGKTEGVSAGPVEHIRFNPGQVEVGGWLQTFSRFAEKARNPSQTARVSHLLCDTGQLLPPSVYHGSKHPLQECGEAEVSPCRLRAIGHTVGLLVKEEYHLPFPREDRASPISSPLHGPPRSSQPLWGP